MSFPRSESCDPVPAHSAGRASARPSRLRRALAGLGFVVGLVLVSTGCLPPLLDPPTSGRLQGKGPLDSIREAADAYTTANPSCGLSSVELAGMMLVPIATESGVQSPSPMTLSRWDNVAVWSLNANLFAFGQTSGPYVNAFFSPGIGLWQFDSAGGWDLTAADAIDTVRAARQAADTIGYRWCTAPTARRATPQSRRAYALGGPWYYCDRDGDTRCEDTYNALVTGDGKLNLGTDATVSRTGGMSQRTCNVYGLADGITCYYVNPALAEGSRSWTAGNYDPARPNGVTPLPKPFYVFRYNGNEYRVWIRDDTGYDIGISAWHPVTSNARTSIQWSNTAYLCDITVARGVCTPPRVARAGNTTYTALPTGGFESATITGLTQVALTGWAIDPDTSDPLSVHAYLDGAYVGQSVASGSRPDVGALFGDYGSNHGFSFTIDSNPGTHQICVYAVNVGPYGDSNPSLGCRTVVIAGEPSGALDSATVVTGGAQIGGWAIDPDTLSPIPVHVYVDGVYATQFTASSRRTDLAGPYPRYGNDHGFTGFVPTTGGTHQICAYGINIAIGSTNTPLGCRSVTVSGQALGGWGRASAGPGGIAVAGWAFDPETRDATIAVTVDGQSRPAVATTTSRPDVTNAYPTVPGDHGFSAIVAASAGPHTICLTVTNQGPTGSDLSLGCRSVTVRSGDPVGGVGVVQRIWAGVRIAGWVIDPDTAEPAQLHVYINGVFQAAPSAALSRPDLAAQWGGYGSNHGFDVGYLTPTAPATVCVFAINVGSGSTNPLLGCWVL